jgi:hypothetical protein
MIQLNHGYRKRFITKLAGIATAADSTPNAILYRNGSASGVTVTVSTTAETGVYLATFTTDAAWAKTDHLELLVSATIDGDSGYKVVLWDSDGEVDAPMRGTDSANTIAPLDATQTQQAAAAAITQAGLLTGNLANGSLAKTVRDSKSADVLFEGQIVTAGSQSATLNGDATTVCVGQAITIGEEGDIERQTRWVTAFDPGTKIVTLDMPWCVIPDNGANYQIKVLRRSINETQTQAAAAAAITAADVATKTKQDETIDLIKAGELDQDVKVV